MKTKHKLLLFLIEYSPVLYTLGIILSNTMYLFKLDILSNILDYSFGTSILSILLMYAGSYAYKFCKWHRVMISFSSICILLSFIDLIIDISKIVMILYIIIGIILLYLLKLYKYEKNRRDIAK